MIENVPTEDMYMDETHVFGTTGLPRGDDPAASLNVTVDQSETSTCAATDPLNSDTSSQQNRSDKVELTCLNQDESPTIFPKGRLVNAEEN